MNNQAERKPTHASSLNAVVDKIIERTQSIASTTASIKMPVLAKRYRPRHVNVQKPHLRYHSLPSKLPPYQSQPSLEDDLRDWMVQTAVSDHFPETDLTRSPTVSSTTGSIASRQEMMKILASFPDVTEDDQHLVFGDPVMQKAPLVQDDAANCPLPSSVPNSPPMAYETANVQNNTALLSSFPLPPSQLDSFPIAPGTAPSQEDASSVVLLQGNAISTSMLTPPSPQVNGPTVASETAHSQEDTSLVVHPQEEIPLAVKVPLPPSQPNSPPLVSEVLHQAMSITIPRRSSALIRKPVPSVSVDSTSTQSSPATSPKLCHPKPFVDGSPTSASPAHVQSNIIHLSKSPRQPQRAPPPPPPPNKTNVPIAASQAEPQVPFNAIDNPATTTEGFQTGASPRSRPPPPIPFFR